MVAFEIAPNAIYFVYRSLPITLLRLLPNLRLSQPFKRRLNSSGVLRHDDWQVIYSFRKSFVPPY